jgi:hypothetical protein
MYAHIAERCNAILYTLANCFVPIIYIKAYISLVKYICVFYVWDVSIISSKDKYSIQ